MCDIMPRIPLESTHQFAEVALEILEQISEEPNPCVLVFGLDEFNDIYCRMRIHLIDDKPIFQSTLHVFSKVLAYFLPDPEDTPRIAMAAYTANHLYVEQLVAELSGPFVVEEAIRIHDRHYYSMLNPAEFCHVEGVMIEFGVPV